MKSSHIRALALIFILIFGFNLVSEIASGDCHEPTSASESQDHPQHLHLCHFGHCGHVVLLTEPSIPAIEAPTIHWRSLEDLSSERDLPPPYKPPIA